MSENPEQEPVWFDELFKVSDGLPGILAGFQDAILAGRVTEEQAMLFLRSTPNGKRGSELWQEFIRRRDAKLGPGYGFVDFMLEVLRKLEQ